MNQTNKLLELEVEGNQRAKMLYGRELFKTVDNQELPDPEVLISIHEEWLAQSLRDIGVDPHQKYISNVFSAGKVADKSLIPRLREIEVQAREASANILQALVWYLSPEFASWNNSSISIHSDNILVDQNGIVDNARERMRTWGSEITNWNSRVSHKSLIVDYYPWEDASNATFHLVVNEHHVGMSGSFDYADSERKFTGIKASFDPVKKLFTLYFEGYDSILGWDIVDGQPIFKLRYAYDLIKSLMSAVRNGESNLVSIGKWRSD